MEEVQNLHRTLAKYIKGESSDSTVLVDILVALEKVTMTYDLLKITKIGQTVSKLRKSNEEEVATKAKFLVRKWKTVAMSPRYCENPPVVSKRKFIPKPVGLSAMRERVREKLVETLSAVSGDAESAATEIEYAMGKKYEMHTPRENKREYSNKFRQLQFNLKKNKQLVADILEGSVRGDGLIEMSADELATEERRQEVRKLRDDAFQKSRLDWAEANADKINKQCGIKDGETGLFKCGRCKSTNTSNTQKQTRSADEPMTVFVLCNNCGNRWKC